MAPLPSPQPGQPEYVVWEKHFFHSQTAWSREPDLAVISSLVHSHLCIPETETTTLLIAFLAQGAFNKVYTIKSSLLSQDYIFRVTLPVHPYYKTASEVATLSYLRRHTSIPVAKVIAYDATSNNKLGFEWILMDCIPGVPLKDIWAKYPGHQPWEERPDAATFEQTLTPWETKQEISRKVARYFLEFRALSFTRIGSLYFSSDMKEKGSVHTADPDFVIGPLVSMSFFYGGVRARVPQDRGPYTNEHHYASALTDVMLRGVQLAEQLSPTDIHYDEDIVDIAPEIIEAIQMLQGVLDVIFSKQADPSGYALYHHDLSLGNMLVDPETFKITGIVDWECLGILPRWEGIYPQFLEGPEVPLQPEQWEWGGEPNPYRTEYWDNWEKMELRKAFDSIIREREDLKRRYLIELNSVEIFTPRTISWVKDVQKLIGDNLLENTGDKQAVDTSH